MEVDIGEFFGNQIQQARLGQPLRLVIKIERFEDVSHGRRKRLDVGEEVFLGVVLVAHQLLHVERRRIEEQLPGLPQQKRFGVQSRLLASGEFGQHSGFGGFQHAVQPAQHCERKDDFSVLGLLVVAPQ